MKGDCWKPVCIPMRRWVVTRFKALKTAASQRIAVHAAGASAHTLPGPCGPHTRCSSTQASQASIQPGWLYTRPASDSALPPTRRQARRCRSEHATLYSGLPLKPSPPPLPPPPRRLPPRPLPLSPRPSSPSSSSQRRLPGGCHSGRPGFDQPWRWSNASSASPGLKGSHSTGAPDGRPQPARMCVCVCARLERDTNTHTASTRAAHASRSSCMPGQKA